jgi:hypothetical protein
VNSPWRTPAKLAKELKELMQPAKAQAKAQVRVKAKDRDRDRDRDKVRVKERDRDKEKEKEKDHPRGTRESRPSSRATQRISKKVSPTGKPKSTGEVRM